MNKINISESKLLSTEQYSELVNVCRQNIDKISEMGPSDNDLNIHVRKTEDGKFLVTLKMVSMSLAFTLQSAAHSPFMAVELATRQAMSAVQKWSATKNA